MATTNKTSGVTVRRISGNLYVSISCLLLWKTKVDLVECKHVGLSKNVKMLYQWLTGEKFTVKLKKNLILVGSK